MTALSSRASGSGRAAGVDVSADPIAMQRLKAEAERAKRALSSQTQVAIELDSIAPGMDLDVTLTRAMRHPQLRARLVHVPLCESVVCFLTVA